MLECICTKENKRSRWKMHPWPRPWQHGSTRNNSKKRAAAKIPTLVIVVFWKHKQAERERKTLIKRHADWQWPLHVGTMQDSKRHMQVAPTPAEQGKNGYGCKYIRSVYPRYVDRKAGRSWKWIWISNLTLKSRMVANARLERTSVPSVKGTVRVLEKKRKQEQHTHTWANRFYSTVFKNCSL